MKLNHKKSILGFAISAALLFTACGDDSSKDNNAVIPDDPTPADTIPNVPNNPGAPTDTSPVIPVTPGDSSAVVPGDSSAVVPGDSSVIPTPGDSSVTPVIPGEIVPFTPQGILIDDFEDGDGVTPMETFWFTYTDIDNDGASVITTELTADGEIGTANEGYQSAHSLVVLYTLDKGGYEYAPYAAVGVGIDKNLDFSNVGGIHYCFKGGAHTLRVETSDIKDYDVHSISVKASRTWTCKVFRFRDFAQEGWGVYKDFVKEHINQVSIQVKGANSTKIVTDSLYIDNVAFINEDALPEDVADLVANPAVIPTVTIGDVTITNPLQEKAMKYLNKGVNFTNWLEEADGLFDGTFEFGEADIKLLAENGFKSIRLPIDLDLYVTNRKAYLAGEETELKMDTETLFKVLDSFDTWTAENGMSFVIDYHEYDNSYNKETCSDTIYISMMAGVWKVVAEHFATSEREDIFLELLNEPDMTNGKVTAAKWTIAAQAMIDAIRSVNTKHTIIFGDAQWYSINLLTKRTPFADTNIIYAIHTYEPFIFSHQGASWTDYGTIKNVPFPYDEKTWSLYSADYGVTAATPASVKTTLNNYYKNGSKEAILEQIYKAKQWAVKNQVPIVINEFGVYNMKSDAQSRLNYYKAMAEICDTLQIPWQHWGYTGGFAVINSEGKLFEGLDEAMGLSKP